MTTTYSPNLRLSLQGTGDNASSWGDVANAVFTDIEASIAGITTVNTTGGTTTLTANNGNPDQARSMMITVTGTLTSNATIVVPSVSKVYLVNNLTSGNFTVTVITSGGTGSQVTQGISLWLWCDGTNVNSTPTSSQLWTTATGTGDAITATYTPAVTSLFDGLYVAVRASAANTLTAPTFSPNGLTAHPIVRYNLQPLAPGDIAGSGHELLLRYRTSGTQWELLNPAADLRMVNAVSASSYTYLASDNQKVVSRASGGISMTDTLPAVANVPAGYFVDAFNNSNVGNTTGYLTIQPTSGTINQQSTYTLAPQSGMRFYSDGTTWHAIGVNGGGNVGGAINLALSASTVTASTTTNIWKTDGNLVNVSHGFNTVTSFGTAPQAGASRKIIATGTFTISGNFSSNITLPNGVNSLSVATGDSFDVVASTTNLTQSTVTNFVGAASWGGRFLRRTIFTANGTWTLGDDVGTILITAVGGGGQGGGAGTGANCSVGSGGGSGGTSFAVVPRSTFTGASSSTATVQVGAGGSGGGNGNNGGNGTASQVSTTTGGVFLCTAGGGGGGKVLGDGSSATFQTGGLGGGAGSFGNITLQGSDGGSATRLSATSGFSGSGAPSALYGASVGGILVGSASSTTGTSANSYGNGGGGGVTQGNGGSVSGGVGSAGLVIIDEYS
jgi:hypothetical protein